MSRRSTSSGAPARRRRARSPATTWPALTAWTTPVELDDGDVGARGGETRSRARPAAARRRRTERSLRGHGVNSSTRPRGKHPVGSAMFGTLGGPELFLILVVALIVFGPRKLPEIGKSIGQDAGASSGKASNDFQRTIERRGRGGEDPASRCASSRRRSSPSPADGRARPAKPRVARRGGRAEPPQPSSPPPRRVEPREPLARRPPSRSSRAATDGASPTRTR